MLPPSSRAWLLGLPLALGLLSWGLFRDFTAPWTDNIDANGACWSQSAHNTLAAGLRATAGVPSAFYFESPPIPESGFYTHHPPLLALLVTASFALLGEHEWAARLVPILSSLIGLCLLWEITREAIGLRGAAFCVLFFASMPMTLHYGRMVNFEPLDLVWMLGAIFCLGRWEAHGRRRWLILFLLCALLCLWTAWLGYLFVLVLCGSLCRRRRQLSAGLLALSLVSLALFAWQVHAVQPKALHEAVSALGERAGTAGFTWPQWGARMLASLTTHIQPVFWVLAAIGALRARRTRLGWVALCFFALSAFYVTAFRNASMIHDYASFYFTIPVALMAAAAVESALLSLDATRYRIAAPALALTSLTLLALFGARTTLNLGRQFHILAETAEESPQLIPELGRAVRRSFAPDTSVICNFIPTYGPQVYYYAQKQFLNCAYEPADWRQFIAEPENEPVGGIIWLGEPRAEQVLASLPAGAKEEMTIRGIPFCLWKPLKNP